MSGFFIWNIAVLFLADIYSKQCRISFREMLFWLVAAGRIMKSGVPKVLKYVWADTKPCTFKVNPGKCCQDYSWKRSDYKSASKTDRTTGTRSREAAQGTGYFQYEGDTSYLQTAAEQPKILSNSKVNYVHLNNFNMFLFNSKPIVFSVRMSTFYFTEQTSDKDQSCEVPAARDAAALMLDVALNIRNYRWLIILVRKNKTNYCFSVYLNDSFLLKYISNNTK